MPEESVVNTLLQHIREYMEPGSEKELLGVLSGTDSIALMDLMFQFSLTEKERLIRTMMPDQAAEVLVRMDESTLEPLLASLDLEELADIISFCEPDDAADLVVLLASERLEPLLAMLSPAERGTIELLLRYGEDTAGGLMDPDVVRVLSNLTVAEAIRDIRRYVKRVKLDHFFSIFVVKEDNTLVGTIPNWRMLLARPEQQVTELMDEHTISVSPHHDQEDVSHLVRHHDLVVVPVVDESDRLIGRITVDDIVDVIEEEHQEDLGHLAGTGAEEVRQFSVWQTIRLRAPWLLVALVGEFGLASFMRSHEGFFMRLPQLAFFIPLIMAMGGNTGIQSSTLVIRGLASGEIGLADFWRRLSREFLVSLSIGLLFALVLVMGGYLLTDQPLLGVAVGVATLTGIILAACMGTAIPMVLKRMNLDPAFATGPFITTMNDILGILVYLGIAYLLLA